ncbi:MAG: hypothetical protein L0312_09590, partial [Acidobacteria bacterium]|nr:hypothetical protein [Acidobacteriota bacterium]
MPGKPYQSILIPYEEEILSLRRQRPPMAFAQIAELLNEKHQVSIQRAAICKFVKVRARWMKKEALENRRASKTGTGHKVLKWFLDLPFDQLREHGVCMVCLGSVTSAPDSVQSFLNWAAALSHHVDYVVFRNLKDGENLYDYDQTRQALEFRETYDPVHVTLPKLSPLYQTELEIRKLTITEVLGLTDHTSSEDRIGPVLSPLLARARLRTYQRGIYEQPDLV